MVYLSNVNDEIFHHQTSMDRKMVALPIALLLFFGYSQAEKCLSGPYHRNESAPGGPDFMECLSYKDDACCTAGLTKTIKYDPEKLYNFTWHHCRAISKVGARSVYKRGFT